MRMIKIPLSYGLNTIQPSPHKHLQLQHIDFQKVTLYGWFLERDIEGTIETPDKFYIANTGDTIPEGFDWYVATAQTYDKEYYVVHAFQQT